ncbi:MAG: tetratricopeptide repeat protein [Gammaproteobacteria bacterium]|nr:tetratricopeptide repeat protein [Gammaproteobacteria bacterium]
MLKRMFFEYKVLRLILILCSVFIVGCQTMNESVRTSNTLRQDQVIADKAYFEGDYIEAERAYKRMTIDNPSESYNWFKLGNIYAKTNRPEKAKEAYKETLVKDPENAKAWHNLGVIQLRQAVLSFVRVQHTSSPDSVIYKHAETAIGLLDEIIEIGDTQ